MLHKIKLKLRNDSNSFSIGRHYKFLLSYYFRELRQWITENNEIDDVTERLDGKLSKQPRNSGFFC